MIGVRCCAPATTPGVPSGCRSWRAYHSRVAPALSCSDGQGIAPTGRRLRNAAVGHSWKSARRLRRPTGHIIRASSVGDGPQEQESGRSGVGPLQKFGSWLKESWHRGAKLDRKKLASLGTSVLLSYGFVSNVNACTLFTIAWVICGKSTGLSPIAPGNWKAFLGIYGGLYLSFGNLLRPLRVSLAIAISGLFERLVTFWQDKFKVKRPAAFGITVFLVNVCGSITYFTLAIVTACAICGTPLLP